MSAAADIAEPPTAIAALAEYLTSQSFDDLSERARHSALRCVLDVVGCAAAGQTNPATAPVVSKGSRWARETFASGRARVWFDNVALSPPGAAFVNSLAASVLDVDDGHRAAAGHPGAAVIPAVVAVGESIGATLEEALVAIVCGYEAGVAVASAREASSLSTRATGRWSALAVAAAIAKLRGFSQGKFADALAIAEAQAPNMAAADYAGFAGSHTKEGIPWSVITGIAAAEQAALGLQGYRGALDNPAIYLKGAIPRKNQGGALIEATYFKPYACCRWIHSAIDAILDMRSGGLDPAGVEQIQIASFKRALSLENQARPRDLISAQFSIPFVVAVALLDGADALLPLSAALLERADVIALAQRVVLALDRELEERFPAQVPARVTVRSKTGTVVREVHVPHGDPGNPLSDSQLTDKAVRLCDTVRTVAQTRAFAHRLLSLPRTSQGRSELLSVALAFTQLRLAAGLRVPGQEIEVPMVITVLDGQQGDGGPQA